MKLIVAMIRADKLQAVQEALCEPGAYIMYMDSDKNTYSTREVS